ncbi:MAG TPA: VCBS repeat-containing protein, partial [Solirubrobacteraceae bacterium]|nr:VCBS repeat-containing protein [Solirubrobacteraceae bacterium]
MRRYGCLVGVMGVLGSLIGLAPAAGALTLRPAPSSPYAVPYGEPVSAAVADFTGDGLLDFVLGTNGFDHSNTPGREGLSVFLPDGAGGFRPAGAPTSLGGGSPVSTVAADFNGDGRSDLAAANSGAVWVFLSTGAGRFAPAPGSPIQAPQAVKIVAADFNGDRRSDLAVLNLDGTISLLLGSGQGTFTPAPGPPIALRGGSPGSIAVGDFNRDGRADLAVTDYSHGAVTVLLGDGDGTFTPSKDSPLGVGSMPGTVVVGDFNGHGRQDLAIATYAGVSVLLGRGDGTFTSAPGSPLLLPDRSPTGLAAGDFNGDGRQDLAVGNQNFGSGLDLLLGDGSGAFRFA